MCEMSEWNIIKTDEGLTNRDNKWEREFWLITSSINSSNRIETPEFNEYGLSFKVLTTSWPTARQYCKVLVCWHTLQQNINMQFSPRLIIKIYRTE